MSTAKRLVAEFAGTAGLMTAVVGSGIVVDGQGPAALQLSLHAAVVGAALVALILMFGPVSGAHFNPAVTAADWWFGGMSGRLALGYVGVQVLGAATGVIVTNGMFGAAVLAISDNPRDDPGFVGAEVLATAGLLVLIFALVRTGRAHAVPGAVGAWIGAAVVFTASDAFANPAVTLARTLTDTWTGIAPGSVPGFLLGQGIGLIAAITLVGWLYDPGPLDAADVAVPTDMVADATVNGAHHPDVVSRGPAGD